MILSVLIILLSESLLLNSLYILLWFILFFVLTLLYSTGRTRITESLWRGLPEI